MEELLDFLDERLSSGMEDGNILLRRRVCSALARKLVEFMSEEQKADLDRLMSALQENAVAGSIDELLSEIWVRIDQSSGSDKKSECIDRILVSLGSGVGGLTVDLAEYLVTWGECVGLSQQDMSAIFKSEL